MLNSIFKHSLRSFKRQKGYFLINLLGLALGLACSLIITLFVIHEFSFDKFNEKGDNIYRLILNGKIGGQEITVSSTAAVIAPTMQRDFPEVEQFCRINMVGTTNLRYNNQNFEERSYMQADSTFFQMFSIPLIHGSVKDVLNSPYKMVISKSTALRIFGDEDPIDKSIQVGTDETYYVVSGIMEDVPENCHFEANIITSFMTNPRSASPIWLNNSFDTYLLLNENADPAKLEEKFPDMVKENVGPEVMQFMGISLEEFQNSGNKYNFFLQPLFRIHLDPSVDQGMKPATDPRYLIIFASVALLIIVIASINFMNLSTAQATKRSREVGMKKVSGSSRSMLVSQFLAESIILSLLALVLAVIIVKLALPQFNNLLNANFGFSLFGNWYNIFILIGSTIVVGLLAGSYPAFYLSSISPSVIFRDNNSKRSLNGRLRSVLVVFQFAASIILIIGTTIMYRQISYMLNKDVGYNKEQLLVISRAGALDNRMEAFKERVREIPGVINISASTAVPNRNNNNNGYMIEGRADESLLMTTAWVDYDFLETFQMEIKEGRFFNRDFPADRDCCILNESAISEYRITDPFSTNILVPGGNDGSLVVTPIIGVVKNFNHESLQRKIQPYIIRFRTDDFQFGYTSVRLAPGNIAETTSKIEDIWKEFTNTESMPYFFMDEDFNRIYRQEKQSATLTVIFAVFALIVAAMGLFGLTSFMLQQRIKEIGVRKAMGASIAVIFRIITQDILLLVTIAALIASPVIYYIANRWLEGYSYRINIGATEFILGYLVAILVALATISYKTLAAAHVNPAISLRNE